MAVLPDFLILELVRSGHLGIDPIDPELVQPATYDLRVGPDVLASPIGPDELGQQIKLTEQRPHYWIQTGQMVAVMSAERLELPLDVCGGGFGIRSEFARRGVIGFGGVQLDPGWRGHVTINLQNVGPEPVKITLGEPLITVTFQRLEQPASKGYEGKHQDQDEFPEEQSEYILSARTTSLAEIPTLRREVARLNVLVEALTDMLPDPDAGLELTEQVYERLNRSVAKPHDSLLTSEEMRKRLNL